jgi:aminomethyltransferase
VQTTLLKKTALCERHVAAGAKMVDFAGWSMPLQFTKVLEEHQTVRERAGLFDISHMGLVSVQSGDVEKTRAFLNRLVPQDLTRLYPGKAVYTQFLNEAGGILDDIIIYMLPEGLHFPGFSEFLVICNASNTARDMAWMSGHQPDEVTIRLQSAQYSLLALQGPRFADVLASAGLPTENLPARFHVNQERLTLNGRTYDVLVCRTGYTGEDGVELVVKSAEVGDLWDGLLEQGHRSGLQPIGLAARDTLRLEAAYPLHGNDIDEDITPLEAGLGWSVKLDQAADFIGKAALRAQQEKGLARKFYCFKLKKKTIARHHDIILKDGEEVGVVTSGSISPTLNEPIAMGFIRTGVVSGPGDILQVRVRGNPVDAEIVERPFYKAR